MKPGLEDVTELKGYAKESKSGPSCPPNRNYGDANLQSLPLGFTASDLFCHTSMQTLPSQKS